MWQRFSLFAAAATFGFASQVLAAIPSDGLAGYWTLDEGAGTTAQDTSGNGNNGNLADGPNNPVWTNSGYSGNGLSFDGNDQVAVATLNSGSFPASGTLSFWIKADFNQSTKNIFDGWTARNHIFIRTVSSTSSCPNGPGVQVAFQDSGSAYRFAKSICGLPSNKWTNLAVSWDTVNHVGYVYVNGVVTYSAAISGNSWLPNEQSFIFGSSIWGFFGNLDDIRLYNRVLSAAEMFDIYTSGDSGTSANESWYSRPAGACTFSGNGKSYGCASGPGTTGAFSGNANIAWVPVSGVDDGDTLYVCGEHVSDGLAIPSGASGSADSRISVSFDCPSDHGSIRMISDMTAATNPASWTNESSNVWYLSTASYGDNSPKRVWIDGTEKVPAQANADLGVSYNGGPASHWWFDPVSRRLYYYSPTNPAGTFSRMESLVQRIYGCAGSALCLADQTVNYIDIINPKLYGGGIFTVNNRGGDRIRIYGTVPDDSACTISLNHTLVVIQDDSDTGTGDPAQFNEVHDCTVDTAYPSYFDGYASTSLSGDGISVRRSSNNHIYSNTVKNTGHTGIYITSTYVASPTTPADNNVVEDNVLRMDSNIRIYGRAVGTDGTLTAPARGNIFRGNMIDGWTVRSQINGTNTQVVNNTFKNQRPDPVNFPSRSDMLSIQGYSGASEGHIIADNVFINSPYGPCISLIHNDGDSPKRNITFSNNILQDCYDELYGTHGALYIQDTVSIQSNAFQDNRIYNSDGAHPPVSYRGTAYSVSDFQTACSNGDVCTGNTGNPLP